MANTTKHRAADRITPVTNDNFDALVLQGRGPIAVEFMSYGCAYCRAIEPVLQDVAEMLKATEKIFRLNVAVESELAEQYEVQSTPTFIMFLDGQEVGRAAGPTPTIPSVLAAVTRSFGS